MKKIFLRISLSIKHLIIRFYAKRKQLERESLRKQLITLRILTIGSILTESMFIELYIESKKQKEDVSTLAKYKKKFEQEKLHLISLIKKLKQFPIKFSPEINVVILNWEVETYTSYQEIEKIEKMLTNYIQCLDIES